MQDRDETEHKIRSLEGDIDVLKMQLQDRSKEVQQVREKSSQEIADLENIAQAHYSRANRLSDELNYLQAEYLDVKERVILQIYNIKFSHNSTWLLTTSCTSCACLSWHKLLQCWDKNFVLGISICPEEFPLVQRSNN